MPKGVIIGLIQGNVDETVPEKREREIQERLYVVFQIAINIPCLIAEDIDTEATVDCRLRNECREEVKFIKINMVD